MKQINNFYLNLEEAPRDINEYHATTTVLEYLRSHGFNGTKEGCATGDCGACSAVTVSLKNNKLVYEGLNTCIAPLPSLAGCLLITVEGLANADGKLHPVQQAMVDQHGSQCGFCTPGFVMSLFAFAKNSASAKREDVVESISGNLCRCTGYLPIIKAGMSLGKSASNDAYAKNEKTIKQNLTALQTTNEHRPLKASEFAKSFYKKPKQKIVAGATDFGIEITQNLARPDILFIDEVKELASIKQTSKTWEIGATTTITQCAQTLGPHLPGFNELIHRFGSPQIRARATIGGNIGNASPIADMPPVLIALGCDIVLQLGDKKRKLPLEDFYTGYRQTILKSKEFIHSFIVNRPGSAFKFNVYKISKRFEDDISSVCAAYLMSTSSNDTIKSVRIAHGGMAATPKRASRCEKVLLGAKLNEATIQKASKALELDYQPMDDLRASARYRSLVSANLLKRFFLESQEKREKLMAVKV